MTKARVVAEEAVTAGACLVSKCESVLHNEFRRRELSLLGNRPNGHAAAKRRGCCTRCCKFIKNMVGDILSLTSLQNNIMVSEFISRRLKFYIESLQQEVWVGPSDSRISGIWQVLTILNQMSYEFESASHFGIRLMQTFEEDVKIAIGNETPEIVKHNIHQNWSPWTVKGREHESAMIQFLQKANSNVADLALPRLPHKYRASLDDALSVPKRLEKVQRELQEDGQKPLTTEEVDEFKTDLYRRLIAPMSKQTWWLESALSRAVSIGVKELWKLEDYKALQYILQESGKIDVSTKEDEGIPFFWVRRIIRLSGPHIVKFKGDSDSYAGMLFKMTAIQNVVLPMFAHEVLDFTNDLKARVRNVNAIFWNLLSIFTAFLIAFFNALMRKWSSQDDSWGD